MLICKINYSKGTHIKKDIHKKDVSEVSWAYTNNIFLLRMLICKIYYKKDTPYKKHTVS